MKQMLSRFALLAGLVALFACSGPGGSVLNEDVQQSADADALVEPADLAGSDGTEPEIGPDATKPTDIDESDISIPDIEEIEAPDAIEPDQTEDVADPDVHMPTCETDEDCLAALENDPGPCLVVYCHVQSGTCVEKAMPDGQPCDNADECTVKSVCVDGACQGSELLCDDGDPCTDDTCDPESGCQHTNNTAGCDDGNPCTANDVCKDGNCVGSGNECPCASDDDCFSKEDGNICNGFLVCIDGSCIVDESTVVDCEGEATACTTVACEPATGNCVATPLENGTACDDGDICTTGDICKGGACLATGEFLCDDDSLCTTDACDPEVGCVFTPTEGECDDGDPCTGNDQCVEGLCVGEAGSNCQCEVDEDCADLEDGNSCNGTLVCKEGSCVLDPATVVKCETPEDETCNVYKCDVETGECAPVPVKDGKLCDSDDPCSLTSECVEGECTGVELDACDDGNPCTLDECVTGEGCQHEAQEGSCDDGNACTEDDTCQDGLCQGTAVQCDDENICTDDSCDPAAGCIYVENDDPCDDGSVCTVTDVCKGGECVGTEELECEETNPCKASKCDPLDGCYSVNIEAGCDDENACTDGDKCVEGECVAGVGVECDDKNPCTDDSCDPATGCVFENNSEPCDDGNACTSDDVCADGLCTSGAAVDCDDDNPCTDDSCDKVEGCVHVANSEACDDGSVCTTKDVCSNSECIGAEPLDCDDDNPCTDDACDPKEGCIHTDNTEPCDDGNVCTLNDACEKGLCQGGGVQQCDDANDCTKDTCDPDEGCVFAAIEGSCDDGSVCTEDDVCKEGNCLPGTPVDCDDKNPCTTDSCDPKLGCVHTNNELACDDGNACTGDDVCSGGVCGGAPVTCDDKNECTDDGCDPETGCIFKPNTAPCDDGSMCSVDDVCSDGACKPGEPLDCNDKNVCTSDTCVPAVGCIHVDNNNACDDGNACTVKDTCSDGECLGGGATICDDQNPCTMDSCDPELGCVTSPMGDFMKCDDGNDCTSSDHCMNGECVGDGLQCDDENPCTDNKCIVGIGCIYPPNSAPCNDGDVCTLDDVCSNGQCGGSSTLNCDDGNPCTDDLCDKLKGCVHINNTDPCDDKNACTEGDTCGDGICVGGTPLTCQDGEVCTDDACDPAIGCVFTNNMAKCDDGNVCTIKDVCKDGVCGGGGDLNCDDSNPCTNDLCLPEFGCIHSYNTDPCDDGNACTEGDVCSAGKCVSGSPLDCDDGNVCTTDSCDPATGCAYANNNFKCNDGDLCTLGDVCLGGECLGKQKNCDDKNPCTKEACDPTTGNCSYSNVEDGIACDDLVNCTVDDVCKGGKCGGSQKDCDDANECTNDLCLEFLGGLCLNQPTAGQACDDGDACTTDDLCSIQGVCGGAPVVCNDYNACTNDFCNEAGECVYEINKTCGVLKLPDYNTVSCNGLFEYSPLSDQKVGWGLDATPAAPGALTGTCSLNYNNGKAYPGISAGSATTSFWYDAGAVTGDMTLAFHSFNGADPLEDNNGFDVRYIEASTDGFNTVAWSKTLQMSEHQGEWVIESFDISALAGEKFQLRFRFDSVDEAFNNGSGWFVEDINVYLGPVVKVATGKGFDEGFEDNANGWQFFGGAGSVVWAIDGTAADPGKFEGASSLNFNNGTDYNAGVTVSGNALSPVIDLTNVAAGTDVSVLFRSWHQTEGNDSYDVRRTEVSALAFTSDVAVLQDSNVGKMNGWRYLSLDLSAFAGKKIRVRFSFNTVDSIGNGYKGWFVDKLSLSTQPVPVFADGLICAVDQWKYANSTPPVIWDVDATAANPGYSSPDCSLNFNNGVNYNLAGTIVKGTASSPAFKATAPNNAGQKLYLDFKSYLGVEQATNFDVTTVTVKDVVNGTIVTQKLSKANLNQWVDSSIDISSLSGQQVQIVFAFDSVDTIGNNTVGPFIDDVIVRAK